MRRQIWMMLLLALTLFACKREQRPIPLLHSPDGHIQVEVFLDSLGRAGYRLEYDGLVLVDSSRLGFNFLNAPALDRGFALLGCETSSQDLTWTQPWGERESIRDQHNRLLLHLQEKDAPSRKLDLEFKAFDDGIGFRYLIPSASDGPDSLILTSELTEFNLTEDMDCWWIPGDWDSYEHLYNRSKITEIDARSKPAELASSYVPANAVHTPLTMKRADGLHLSIHEAALLDYPGMTLEVLPQLTAFVSALEGRSDGVKAIFRGAFQSPWRSIQVSKDAPGLLQSNLILNLNEPSKLEDISWFKPMKYCGIWWEMHIDKSTWSYEGGRHGATTANAKRYIDFAAANGLGGVLVEGWNTGWERWYGTHDREGLFDFVTAYPDYDLQEVAQYARSKQVALIMHHETSSAPRTYAQQLDSAYRLMEGLGIHALKSGYVGNILPVGEHHHGQWMVNHYQMTVEAAARHKIAINIHEPIKDTGLRRTWPNLISREGLRGQEFNAWSRDGGNPPEHLTIVPFTRMLAGPIDFTPGIFHLSLKPFKPNNQINTTLAQQLATYVVIYSPIQMAADLPEHYEGQPAFQFIRDVACDWSESICLNGEIGEYITMARKERGKENWFVGSINGKTARKLSIDLNFLEKGQVYKATIYQDAAGIAFDHEPEKLEIKELELTKGQQLEFWMASGGGMALSLSPK